MIIHPKSDVPIAVPEAPLSDIYLFPVYQSREDVYNSGLSRSLIEKVLPPCNQNRRAKHWFDPRYVDAEDDGEPVIYDVVQFNPNTGMPVLDQDGKPKITKLAMEKSAAGRMNIGTGRANEFPLDSTYMRLKPYPVPIRELHPDEELAAAAGFGAIAGNVVVRNKKLYSPPVQGLCCGFTEEDRRVLLAIARKLGI